MATPGSSDDAARADHNHGPLPNPDKTVIRRLTNASGLNIDWGDVVIQDTSGDDQFTTNTTLNYSAGWIGVALATIGSNTKGPVLLSGYTPVINVGSNSTTRGQLLYGSNMARRAYGSNSRTTGAFGQALTTSPAPDAIIWPVADGAGGAAGVSAHSALTGLAADDHTQYVQKTTLTTRGDLFYRNASAVTRLAVGASNFHLVSDGVDAMWASSLVSGDSSKASGTGDVTTTASLADVTGATLSPTAGTYIVVGVFDTLVNDALNDRTFEGHLDVGGVDENDYGILVAPGLVNVRAAITQVWRVVLASTTTVKLRTLHTGGTVGDFTVKSTNTTITAYRAGGSSGYAEGTSFPASPTNDQKFFRTDRDLLYFYDGTRWLTVNLYELPISNTRALLPFSATSSASIEVMVPHSGVYNLWLEDFQTSFYVDSGGSALSASHKWVVTLLKAPAGTTIATANIDSGASTTYRTSGQVAIDALVGTTEMVLAVYSTKTGTPGNLYVWPTVTYRMVG